MTGLSLAVFLPCLVFIEGADCSGDAVPRGDEEHADQGESCQSKAPPMDAAALSRKNCSRLACLYPSLHSRRTSPNHAPGRTQCTRPLHTGADVRAGRGYREVSG